DSDHRGLVEVEAHARPDDELVVTPVHVEATSGEREGADVAALPRGHRHRSTLHQRFDRLGEAAQRLAWVKLADAFERTLRRSAVRSGVVEPADSVDPLGRVVA